MTVDAFPRRAGAVLLKLGTLYALYAVQALKDFPSDYTLVERMALTVASAGVILSVLVPVAVLVAAGRHFDPVDEAVVGGRKRQWMWLALMGMIASAVSMLGPAISDLAMGVLAPPSPGFVAPESPASTAPARLIVPLAIGIQVVLAGVAGAMIEPVIQWAPRWRRLLWRWAACLAVTVSFWLPVVGVGALVDRYGPVWAWAFLSGPLALPLVGTWTLLRLRRIAVRDLLPVSASNSLPVDPETLDQLLSAVGRTTTSTGLRAGIGTTEEEARLGRFLVAVREAATSSMETSDQRMEELVRKTLAAAPATVPRPARKRSLSWQLPLDWATASELVVSWGGIAAGVVVLGMVGGVSPNAAAAGTVGLVGAAAGVWLARRRPLPGLVPASA